ncbi:stage III sporulation protein AG [Garciella nitratireducens]|uniref:Stage III sporulation protein AG n=1 Tax=Garciella nitratireducens DSM 15102 TaxID=1121911 RepID=A0A1T4K426_9FIRM|nr:stage III sporulation protein AG [Garciella nitratireducens]RBP46661.1 stage III sporulation protein AG [Garciella nitratireducens]SJZ37169.1 stage III sporulation protein AG [Garciella nitratireducens DSM 15102]
MINLKEFFSKIQKGNLNKNILNLVIFGFIGIAFILVGSFFSNSTEKEQKMQEEKNALETQNFKNTDYEAKIQYELKEILSSIEGVGDVDIMITVENEGESEIAYSKNETQNVTKEKDDQGGERVTDQKQISNTPVMSNADSGNSPFVVKESMPEISGIIVVADGAKNPEIKYQLSQAVQTALGLPSHKVVIYARGE